MPWLFVFVFSLHADLAREQLKARVCESMHDYTRRVSVEACFNGHFKFKNREAQVTDFEWHDRHFGRCFGTIYDDAGDIHFDGCAK